MTDAFWAESYQLSPQQTAVAIETALCQLVSASDPDMPITVPDPQKFTQRTAKQLTDLVQLTETLNGALPDSLAAIRASSAGTTVNVQAASALQGVLSAIEHTGASRSLAVLQAGLFVPSATPTKLDASVQWVGVRDFLEEAEVAAHLVQSMLAEHSDLILADIGLLLPDSVEYPDAINDVFTRVGLAACQTAHCAGFCSG